MFNFIMGIVIGVVVATFGLGTVVAFIDNGVSVSIIIAQGCITRAG